MTPAETSPNEKSNVAGGRKRAAVVIPARLVSHRFPRKVLARETGKYLIQHVWEGVVGTPEVERVIIATDSEEVLEAARSFGAEARLTSPSHISGTDRVAEVARDLSQGIIINVQGDEPMIRKEDVSRIITLFEGAGEDVVMTTLAVDRQDREGHRNPNNVKVVRDLRGRAVYFSRSPIPWRREVAGQESESWLHHVGIYGYRRDFLLQFANLQPGKLEKIEKLEQLRVLEHGFRIQVGLTPHRYEGIDTVEEYEKFVLECRGG